jgi:hypothetical protein
MKLSTPRLDGELWNDVSTPDSVYLTLSKSPEILESYSLGEFISSTEN